MRLALISDIHGNITGLKAVFGHIQKIGGVDALYALGDLVGFGVAADEVLDLLQHLPIRETVEIAPDVKLFLCHAAPNDTWASTCQADIPTPRLREVYGTLDAQIIAYGHYRRHHVLALDGKLLLCVKSVGLREDGLSALTILGCNGHLSIQQLQVRDLLSNDEYRELPMLLIYSKSERDDLTPAQLKTLKNIVEREYP